MSRRYTKEMHDWLREHIPLQSCEAVAADFERTFGWQMTKERIKCYAANHKIHTRQGTERLTPEWTAWLIEHGPGTNSEDLTAQFNATFGTHFTIAQINAKRYKVGAVSGLKTRVPNSGCFQKGSTPANKGKRQSEYMSEDAIRRTEATRFHVGHTPADHRPVGSERVNVDGYIEIKVAEPNTWRLKHRVVWESAHGTIPPKHAIVFLDGDRLNCAADNLELIDLATNARLNQMHLRYADPQLTKTGVAIAKVVCAMGKRNK